MLYIMHVLDCIALHYIACVCSVLLITAAFSSTLYTHVQSLLHVIACSGVIVYIIHCAGLGIKCLLIVFADH